MRGGVVANPNWWLAAVVATGTWFGAGAGLSSFDPTGRKIGSVFRQATEGGWASRVLIPVQSAGCAAGLILLLIWGLRVLELAVVEPAQARRIASQPGIDEHRRTQVVRSWRRGGLYGP